MISDIQIIPPDHKIPLRDSEKQNFLIRRSVNPAEWAEENFTLTTAYARPGKLKLWPWQREPVNAINDYDVVILAGAVQTGKSLISECHLAWIIDCHPMNAMICYAKADTAKSIFDERLKPMVEEVKCINKYWDKNPDKLTQKKISLSHMIMRIASAEVKSDIATYSAGYVYASEVSKYPVKDFDQIKALFGRQEGYRILGTPKATIESSPDSEGDPLHALMYRKGIRNCDPYQRCPHCGHWQILMDDQIVELPDEHGEFDHNPDRIRTTNSSRYECIECKNEITEMHRVEMSNSVVWADQREKITPDGRVINKIKTRWVSYSWNRLIDFSFTFSECLARFFEARQSINPNALKTYQNEDMARFAKRESKQFSTNWLMAKRDKYTQYGENASFPSNVIILTCGIDTQDAGFYYVVRGWGAGMESWLIRHDWLECSIKDEKYNNPDEIVSLFNSVFISSLPARADGVRLPITCGFIDRGGHRAKSIDYLCSRISFLHPYVGTVNKKAPLIARSKEKNLFLGNTENLSKVVEGYSEAETWHLPEDVTDDYCSQFLKQFWQDKYDKVGNIKNEYVHGGKDHYRDAENYNIGAAIYLQLEQRMYNETEIDKIKDVTEKPHIKQERQTEQQEREYTRKFEHPRRPSFNKSYLNRYHNF